MQIIGLRDTDNIHDFCDITEFYNCFIIRLLAFFSRKEMKKKMGWIIYFSGVKLQVACIRNDSAW